jgi:hypothetical protein
MCVCICSHSWKFHICVVCTLSCPVHRLQQSLTTTHLLCRCAPTLALTCRLKEVQVQAQVAAAGAGELRLEQACCSLVTTLGG